MLSPRASMVQVPRTLALRADRLVMALGDKKARAAERLGVPRLALDVVLEEGMLQAEAMARMEAAVARVEAELAAEAAGKAGV